MKKMIFPVVLLIICLSSRNVFAQDIFEAAKKNDTALIESLLEKNGESVNAKDENGMTPLQYAVLYGHRDLVDLLIQRGADINAQDTYGRTALWHALQSEESEIVSQLLASGATVAVTGEEGRRTLHKAAWTGCKELLAMMLEKGAERSSRNDNAGTLLHSVVRGRLTEWVKRLLDEGFDPDAHDRYGLTPLHLAAIMGFDEEIALLIGKGADMNASAIGGKTAYHLALDNGQGKSAELLLKMGAEKKPPKFPVLQGDYFGQKTPGMQAELFAPGIVSTMEWEHGGPVFSSDGNEMYWSPVMYGASRGCIMVSRRIDGRWTLPGPVSFTKMEYREMGPGLTPDGKRIFFTSYRPIDEAHKDVRIYNIWFVERIANGWSDPKPLPPPVNADGSNARSTLARGGVLYFGSWRTGRGCLFRSQLRENQWSEPELLPINSNFAQICSYVSPDDKFLIFESSRPGGFGGFDLYVAFRHDDGTWSLPVNLGEKVNSPAQEWFASMSHDGKYLFFTSNRNGNDDVYWIDVRAVEALRPKDEIKTARTSALPRRKVSTSSQFDSRIFPLV